jgi:hypothetical protein
MSTIATAIATSNSSGPETLPPLSSVDRSLCQRSTSIHDQRSNNLREILGKETSANGEYGNTSLKITQLEKNSGYVIEVGQGTYKGTFTLSNDGRLTKKNGSFSNQEPNFFLKEYIDSRKPSSR